MNGSQREPAGAARWRPWRRWGVVLGLLCGLGLFFPAGAQPRLGSPFSDGLVLQRDRPVPVWGWAEPGATVRVALGGVEAVAVAAADGTFRVTLGPLAASAQPRVMTVSAPGGSVKVAGVLVGEVWLCSGQSNMVMPLAKVHDAAAEMAAADFPQVRVFRAASQTSRTPEPTCRGSWRACTPETAGKLPATAYFFGRALHRELGVPVGLLHAAVGASNAASWTPRDTLEQFVGNPVFHSDVDVAASEWLGRKNAKDKLQKADRNEPAALYNAMIHPLIPYGLRGTIWYQGERNAKTLAGAAFYRELLGAMVERWRSDWGRPMPFYAVQLVNYRKPSPDPVQNTPWAVIRESFVRFADAVPNTGVVVGIDVGEAHDIHPKNKRTIGERLARLALVRTYGAPGVPGGPRYRSARIEGGRVRLVFDQVGGGLTSSDRGVLKRFAIAGADQRFVHAQARVDGGTLVVWSPEVRRPVAVRYAWADNPQGCNLVNEEGFPASPFRTDTWAIAQP